MDPRNRNNLEEEDVIDKLTEEIMHITEDQQENTQTEESMDAGEGTNAAPAVKKMNLAQLLKEKRRPQFFQRERVSVRSFYLQEEKIDTSDDPLAQQ